MYKFFNTIKNIWKIKELKKKISKTFFILLIYRFTSYIPLVGINIHGINKFLNNINPGIKGLMQIISSFTGGAFNRASIMALGIMPYISASIIIQLISLIIPYFQIIQKEEESGSRKINYITRWLTIIICMIQAPAYIIILTTKILPFSSIPEAYLLNIANPNEKFIFWITSSLLLTTGTIFAMWLGEKITDKGIGNGISLIIMVGIISKFPQFLISEINNRLETGNNGLIFLFFEFILWFFVILFSILIIQAVRKIPIQYIRNTQNYNTNNLFDRIPKKTRQYIPLKVLSSGVMPIIFSQAIMLLPSGILSFIKKEKFQFFRKIFENIYGFWYNSIFFILIILFTFFYTAITISVNQISNNLKRNEAYIPKIKPGKDTSKYLDDILFRITVPGSILLGIIAILPSISIKFGVTNNFSLFYGGTSLLIIIGVILDTYEYINSYLLNYKYDNLIDRSSKRIY